MKQKIIINLWFNNNAKEAVDYYLSIFKKSRILSIDYYTGEGEEITGHKEGDIVTIEFEILGMKLVAINAGPEFSFNPSVSLSIECKNQNEIDYYWERLSAAPESEACGWLQDKYGLSWQINPTILGVMMKKGNNQQRKAVTKKYLSMKKFIIEDIVKAFRENK